MPKLLTRDEFRTATLKKNKGNCVVPSCGKSAVDAHHILNRNLFVEPFEFGGYFIENGSGLCSEHHLDAERTLISTTDLYKWGGIHSPAIPAHFDDTLTYDTWGNTVLGEHQRKAGELFEDEGCQKALAAANLLWTFWC